MTPGQEAKGDNLGKSFRSFLRCRYVECIHKNRLDEAILMSTYKNANGDNLGKSFRPSIQYLYVQCTH